MKPKTLVELERVLSPKCFQRLDGAGHVRVQVDSRRRRLAIFVIASQPQRETSARRDDLLDVVDERATDSHAAMGWGDDERVNLPDTASVAGDRANPAENLTGIVDRNPADAIRRQRIVNFLKRRREILPVFGSVKKRSVEQRGGLFDVVAGVTRQIEDHFPKKCRRPVSPP